MRPTRRAYDTRESSCIRLSSLRYRCRGVSIRPIVVDGRILLFIIFAEPCGGDLHYPSEMDCCESFLRHARRLGTRPDRPPAVDGRYTDHVGPGRPTCDRRYPEYEQRGPHRCRAVVTELRGEGLPLVRGGYRPAIARTSPLATPHPRVVPVTAVRTVGTVRSARTVERCPASLTDE